MATIGIVKRPPVMRALWKEVVMHFHWIWRALCQSCGVMLVLAGAAGTAQAGFQPGPEIDPGSMMSALTLLTGGALLLTSRVRRQ